MPDTKDEKGNTLVTIVPITEADFDELAKLINEKLTPLKVTSPSFCKRVTSSIGKFPLQ